MNNLWQRAITGSIFVAVLLLCAVFNELLLASLFLIFVVIGTKEYFGIVNYKKEVEVNLLLGYAVSVTVFVLITSIALFDLHLAYLALLFPLVAVLFIKELFRLSENGFGNILHTIMPSLYIATPFALFIVSNSLLQDQKEYNAHFTLVFFFTLWANDTGAYLAGKSFGKRKLFPQISPNKTWEGTLGGAVLAILVAYNCGIYFTEMNRWEWVSMAFLIVVFGSFGDLVESMLKRNYGVKDAGNILPGHGGILDRFDGLLVAAPVVFSFLVLKGFFL